MSSSTFQGEVNGRAIMAYVLFSDTFTSIASLRLGSRLQTSNTFAPPIYPIHEQIVLSLLFPVASTKTRDVLSLTTQKEPDCERYTSLYAIKSRNNTRPDVSNVQDALVAVA